MQADLEDGLTDVRDPPWAPVVGAAEDVASVEFLSEVNPAYQVRFNKFAFLVKKSLINAVASALVVLHCGTEKRCCQLISLSTNGTSTSTNNQD